MCDIVGQAIQAAEAQRLSRRTLLKGSVATGAGLLATGSLGTASAAAADRPEPPTGNRAARRHRTRLVLLGTAGGPVWWPGTTREGISSAVVVGEDVYVIDCGEGVFRQYRRAGLGPPADRAVLQNLRGIFLTHLHSDHMIDYFNVWAFGSSNGLQLRSDPVRVFGPGNRGGLPPVYGPPEPAPVTINPENPTPGTVETTDMLVRAYATDLNDRSRDNRQADPRSKFEVHDIDLPPGLVSDPNVDPAPRSAPFAVFEDENVKVTATLVDHRPVFPSFGFRFDTADGSIVFSGDTGPDENLIELAQGADILVHEVIDPEWVTGLFPDPTTPEAQSTIAHLLNSHTTIDDVGDVAERAGVKTLVLSHLVPANTPERRWRQAGRGFSGRLVVGRDLQEIGVGRRRRA